MRIPGATVKYNGASNVEVHCNTTGETFSLMCRGNQWKGKIVNCTAGR